MIVDSSGIQDRVYTFSTTPNSFKQCTIPLLSIAPAIPLVYAKNSPTSHLINQRPGQHLFVKIDVMPGRHIVIKGIKAFRHDA